MHTENPVKRRQRDLQQAKAEASEETHLPTSWSEASSLQDCKQIDFLLVRPLLPNEKTKKIRIFFKVSIKTLVSAF